MAQLLSGITGAASGAVDALKNTVSVNANTKEKMTLEAASVPNFLIDFYQTNRRALGFAPQSGSTLIAIGVVIAVVVYIVGSILASLVMGFLNQSAVRYFLIGLLVLLGIYLIYYYGFKPDTKAPLIAEARNDIYGLLGKEPFQTMQPSPDDSQPLINLQPLAIRQTGYIGPKERGGVFELEAGLNATLKAGIRFFTLQIDYLDAKKDRAVFAKPGEPTLLYRDDSLVLVSKNGADLAAVAQGLANYAFSEQVVNNGMPLIIYLHFVKTPNAVKEPEKYVTFLRKTAIALGPLLNNHLGLTGDGTFARQQAEATLFTTPISAFQKRVIFLCNADTSMLRNLDTIGMKRLDPKEDLDYLVNARVYAETTADAVGATGLAVNDRVPPAAVLVSLPRILGLGDKDKEAFAQRGKGRFVIAMGKQIDGNPTPKDLRVALGTLGVNAVPMNLFGDKKDELAKLVATWKDKFYALKPVALHSVRTTPVGLTVSA